VRVVILGATGRLGSLAMTTALAAGYEVVAYVRRHPESGLSHGVTAVVGAIDDGAALRDALAGSDAVIAAIGARSNEQAAGDALAAGMRALVEAMEGADVRRLVALSGAAVDVPGDHKPAIDRLASRVVRRVTRHVVEAKQREYEIFSASQLDWTALRPAIVTDGAPRGYRLSEQLRPGARVTRSDVAQALVDSLADDTFVRKAPFVLPA
jgi:putative NADH-flavin reductase